MDYVADQLAHKYALAFMQYAHGYAQEPEFCLKLSLLADFIQEKRKRLSLQSVEQYAHLLELFNLKSAQFISLLKLLKLNQRLFLFKNIIKKMSLLYREHNRFDICTLASSHDLSTEQRAILLVFLENKLRKKIFYHYMIDKSLIAGIRAIGTNFVWDTSLDRKLRIIEQSYI